MDGIINFLKAVYNKEMYFSEKGCMLINSAQEMITRERIVIRDERNLLIPACGLQLVDGETIRAFSTKIENEYWIFVNKGIIEEQKIYLGSLDWTFISEEKQKEEYIDNLIEYGFYFTVFHEYAHILCGHTDAGLNEYKDKRAQECEADMFSMDYLIKYVQCYRKTRDFVEELKKLFLAIYFLFEKKQKQNVMDYYNNKIMQNYYDPDIIEKRNHPLDSQRVSYLYDMLNVIIMDNNKIQVLPIKEEIIEIIKSLKRLTYKDIPKREFDYEIFDDSVQNLKMTLQDIWVKIPRLYKDSEGRDM